MSAMVNGRDEICLPKFFPVRQSFVAPEVEDIPDTIKMELSGKEIKGAIKPGDKVAVAVGSRGISNITLITRSVINELKSWGAEPFIIPSMGSHGGGTGQGQKNVLAGLGITEESMGVPIISEMEVEEIGRTKSDIPVFLDREALQADKIVVINRVKPHTSFKGEYESGLLKMLAIGLGRHKGATTVHEYPLANMPVLLPEFAQVYLKLNKVAFGVAILENAYDRTAKIEAVPSGSFLTRDRELLLLAKKYMPKILPEKIDVLVVSEIGKNISGSGMDPNITGRSASKAPQKFNAPSIERIIVLGLTKETKGNATGIGMADITTEQVYKEMNLDHMYINVITSKVLGSAKIPVIMKNERAAIEVALKTCYEADLKNPRIVFIKNTLELEKIWVSEALKPEVEKSKTMTQIGELFSLEFDKEDNLLNEFR
ncbi:lactate racemase domain-containing protein [Halalkalibacter oceani]|uniref:lactate racemase domain-containing protein n=1 Tax=Halalkalibacter oceani TaxID=1653776 RepID=UPI0020422C08|nr:lactate racemase domain-containing protein [Halalkalibacter oceani]MCM3761984.1 nickel-dependent lactate racemase [Halalkalibacter oceani]